MLLTGIAMLWSDSERALLASLLPRHSVPEIAKRFGRTRAAIRSAIERQKLGRPKRDTWSNAEVDLLRVDWPHHSAGVIAQRLNRTRNAVIGKIHRLRFAGNALRLKPSRLAQHERPRPKPVPPHRKPKPMTPPRPLPAQPIQCPCQLVELEPINCKWPIGNPHEPDFFFCGAIVAAEGLPYCPAHHRKAHHEPR
jgi:GcrA cell cycle regulator